MSRPSLQNDSWFMRQVERKVLEVTTSGRVTNLITGKRIGSMGRGGYMKISMQDKQTGRVKSMQVHRLVWLTYKGKLESGVLVNHKDGVKSRNRLSNLEPTSYSGNLHHAVNTLGVMKAATYEDVAKMRRLYALGKSSALELAERFGLHRTNVSKALRGVTFKEVITQYDARCLLVAAARQKKTRTVA